MSESFCKSISATSERSFILQRGFVTIFLQEKERKRKKFHCIYRKLVINLDSGFWMLSIFVYSEETNTDLYINIFQSLKETTDRMLFLLDFGFEIVL